MDSKLILPLQLELCSRSRWKQSLSLGASWIESACKMTSLSKKTPQQQPMHAPFSFTTSPSHVSGDKKPQHATCSSHAITPKRTLPPRKNRSTEKKRNKTIHPSIHALRLDDLRTSLLSIMYLLRYCTALLWWTNRCVSVPGGCQTGCHHSHTHTYTYS